MNDDPITSLERGLYESLVTQELYEALQRLEAGAGRLVARRPPLRGAEAADRIALHLQTVLRRALGGLAETQRAARGLRLLGELLTRVAQDLNDPDCAGQAPATGEVLEAILARRPDGRAEELPSPLTPLLDTTLLSNAPREPNLVLQLQSEIASADRIDLLMAFIRRSGLRPLRESLERHLDSDRSIRVLTTTFTGTTEAEALEELARAGAEVRVSYDTSASRLHAKSWLFHRNSGFSTAFVGSSNLTQHAQVTGLEWNLRVSGARNPDVLRQMEAVFETHWQSGDFVPFDRAQFEAERQRHAPLDAGSPRILLSPLELRPEPFQARLLEQLELARHRGHHRNLLVAATGTGKTVMAALDYAALRESWSRARLLFVAHRAEILEQSLATFRQALRAPSFGELWVRNERPRDFEHVFASIQSLQRADLALLPPDHFDIVIVDEFHHAAAPSYEQLLRHLRPKELLGLTATPERADGLDVLGHFDGRIAAELRLWDAIDRQYLVPFVYYGIHDSLDLREIPWRRGRGYDVEGLTGLLTGNDAWAGTVLNEYCERVDTPHERRALGFCVSVDHARYMARFFDERGITARAVWGDTAAKERQEALEALGRRDLQVLFSVDLFAEGVDLPDVDTLLLLRPTDSPVLFLQQLGRGLRRRRGKTHCTVLDFVAQHRKEYRFDRRLRSLLGGTRKELLDQIERGFPLLPAGCHLQLDRKAEELILENIRSALPERWTEKVEELRRSAAMRGGSCTLAQYLEDSGLELEDLYGTSDDRAGWTDLQRAAGLAQPEPGPHEKPLQRAIGRLLHVDDQRRIDRWSAMLLGARPPDVTQLVEHDRRLLHMLIATLMCSVATKTTPLQDAAELLWQHASLRDELAQLLEVLKSRVEHLHAPLATHPEVPLQVHARYSRNEILAAFGVTKAAKIPSWQTGVRYIEHARADLLAFTIDKSQGGFSPTTRYEDYAISRELIHWQSQDSAHPATPAGRRYLAHATQGTFIFLFARATTRDKAYWFLGPARYVRHEGSRPMSITWQLEHPLPGDLLPVLAATVA